MNNNEDWSKAGDFLNNLFDEVSKGFQKAAEDLEKQYPNGFNFDFMDPERRRKDRPFGEPPFGQEHKPFGEPPKDGMPPFGPKPGPEGRGHHPRRPIVPVERPNGRPGRRGFGPEGKGIPADIIDYGDTMKIAAVLPGFLKTNIEITLKGEELFIKATKDWREVEDQEKYVAIEQPYGTFERRFFVGKVDADSISANYLDGILYVNLTKMPEPQGSSITID